jgi:hypothetical protein
MIPTLREEFVGIKGTTRPIEEAFAWMIKVIKVKTIDKYDALEDIILNPFFKLFCNPNNMTNSEKRLYLKSLATGYESYLKKLFFLVTGNEVTDRDGSVEHAALGNALYATKLNKLKYSDNENDKKFATYLDLLIELRNEEAHSGKTISPEEIAMGIHIVTTMYLYVTFHYITDLELTDLDIDENESHLISLEPQNDDSGYVSMSNDPNSYGERMAADSQKNESSEDVHE